MNTNTEHKNILTAEKFSIEVETLFIAEQGRLSLFESLMEVANKYDLDETDVPSLLSITLYEKLENEAGRNNLLKEKITTSNALQDFLV